MGLIRMNNTRDPYHCYKRRTTWATKVKGILFKYGLGTMFE